MRVLYIGYALWKTIVQTNSLMVYARTVATNTRKVWSGARDVIYCTDVEPADYADFDAAFPSPTAVVDEDEALARIIGLTTVLAPRDALTGNQIVHLDGPEEADRKPVMVVSPFTEGLYMFVSACGDARTEGVVTRGGGQQLHIDFTEASAATLEAVATFHECVEMHDGHIDFDPSVWGFHDLWSVVVRIPKTPITQNGTAAGNCNIASALPTPSADWDSETAYSPGEMVTSAYANWVCTSASTGDNPMTDGGAHWLHYANVIVPAAGDGYWGMDLADAVALPYEGGGYWDYDPWDDEFTPSATPGYADWMLMDFAQDDVALVRNMACSSRLGYWELDAYKVEPIYARWQFVLSVTRDNVGSRGDATIGGHYTCFREVTT